MKDLIKILFAIAVAIWAGFCWYSGNEYIAIGMIAYFTIMVYLEK